ncbi:hypothetical protein, partial [Enterococcus faecium]|uniref:hypothetical protein n=1 Tax=Enterococcus faecium TaxID=1352 RepID=UPI003F528D4D
DGAAQNRAGEHGCAELTMVHGILPRIASDYSCIPLSKMDTLCHDLVDTFPLLTSWWPDSALPGGTHVFLR